MNETEESAEFSLGPLLPWCIATNMSFATKFELQIDADIPLYIDAIFLQVYIACFKSVIKIKEC